MAILPIAMQSKKNASKQIQRFYKMRRLLPFCKLGIYCGM